MNPGLTGTVLIAMVLFSIGSQQVLAKEQKIACTATPQAAQDSFKAAFPNATIKNCVKDSDNGKVEYEFSSDEGKTHRDVSFDGDGKLMVSEETIAVGDIPEPVHAAVNKKYPGDTVTSAEKVTRADSVRFELRVKHKGKRVEAVFDPDGNDVTQ